MHLKPSPTREISAKYQKVASLLLQSLPKNNFNVRTKPPKIKYPSILPPSN